MRLNKVLYLLCFLSIALISSGREKILKDLLEAPGLKNASVGLSVKSLKDGAPVLEYASEMSMQPASLVKLFATGLALDKCGSGFRYETVIKYSGVISGGVLKGNILIEPSGDPCFDSRYFPEYKLIEKLCEQITQAGIKEVEGRILIKGEEDYSVIRGSWLWEDVSNYFAAPYFSFNYRDNTYWLEFQTGVAGTPAKLLTVEPELPGMSFVNEVTASTKPGDHAWIFGGPYSPTQYISGTLPQKQASFKIKGAMYSPQQCFVKELSDKLQQKGIVIQASPVEKMPDKAWFVLQSPLLEEIVKCTNKQSVNLFSEALSKLSGEHPEVALKSLLTRIGADTLGVVLKDGCGLSALSAIPAGVFTDFLLWADRTLGAPFFNSLPIAGVDRGLNPYCRNYPLLKNNLRAKTGSFFGVRSLAGYFTDNQGEKYAFCLMINHYNCPSSELYDAVGHFLTEWIKWRT